MKLSQKIEVFEQVGLIEWFVNNSDQEKMRFLINRLADEVFDNEDYFSFLPGEYFDSLYFHFLEAGYDIDWFSLLSGEFADQIREFSISDIYEHGAGVEDTYRYDFEVAEQAINDFLSTWRMNCRREFIARL